MQLEFPAIKDTIKMSEWKTMEDIERDLFEYSQLEYPGSSLTIAPPKSIAEYRARTTTSRNPGIFDDRPERREIFISGRGKHHPGTIIIPGQPVVSTPEEDMDLRRKIREVSGLGYGNELTESLCRQEVSSEEEESNTGFVLPNLKLRPSKPNTIQKKNVSPRKSPKLEAAESKKKYMKKELNEMKALTAAQKIEKNEHETSENVEENSEFPAKR
ncbi:uncharacterized protein LOC123682911 isoform X1 [Harmonia axyridis]|uniref:uncharacterized protein LOC123682911 isoform X1 n=1 Tax=Harmonia axyridis TaxID=115357 RepID=UPI001E278E34|nr:uncharacterized protein LOC123682911 isoform X1 [Harmonia axyridis]